jgi:DNA invertase Pin-like site-specific DNA recombinase
MHPLETRDFDFLLSCELDRLGRTRYTREDIADLVDVGVHCIFIRDHTDTRDENSDLILDIKANQAGAYSKSVARYVRATMIDRAKQKHATGKPPFGYLIDVKGGASQTVHGREKLHGALRTYVIDPVAAEWVRKMFAWFVDGDSAISIAKKLNEAGAPSPRGRGWIVSSVAAVIDNSMYLGQLIYNKSKWVARSRKQRRAAGLGRRKRVENPADQWIRQDAPELRIIDVEVWRAAQARRSATNKRWHASPKEPRQEYRGRPSKQLFELRCGICGGSVTMANGHKLGCSKAPEQPWYRLHHECAGQREADQRGVDRAYEDRRAVAGEGRGVRRGSGSRGGPRLGGTQSDGGEHQAQAGDR